MDRVNSLYTVHAPLIWSRLELVHSVWVYWEPELMLWGSFPMAALPGLVGPPAAPRPLLSFDQTGELPPLQTAKLDRKVSVKYKKGN